MLTVLIRTLNVQSL